MLSGAASQRVGSVIPTARGGCQCGSPSSRTRIRIGPASMTSPSGRVVTLTLEYGLHLCLEGPNCDARHSVSPWAMLEWLLGMNRHKNQEPAVRAEIRRCTES